MPFWGVSSLQTSGRVVDAAFFLSGRAASPIRNPGWRRDLGRQVELARPPARLAHIGDSSAPASQPPSSRCGAVDEEAPPPDLAPGSLPAPSSTQPPGAAPMRALLSIASCVAAVALAGPALARDLASDTAAAVRAADTAFAARAQV